MIIFEFILLLNFLHIPDFFMQVLKYLPWFIYFIILFEIIGILKTRLEYWYLWVHSLMNYELFNLNYLIICFFHIF